MKLSRREREIMDVLHALERATAHEVQERLSDPPSYSATRALLAVLERKGHITHKEDGPRYVYSASVSKAQAQKSALSHVVDVFFGGSIEQAMTALLDQGARKLSRAELDRLAAQVAAAKKAGR